jgi:two-component system, NarL family, nitrate/nitrite response regulator NarL
MIMRDIRILMVDDHSLFRESLSRLLEANPNFRIVGQCATASEAVDAFTQINVDVVLLDYDLGEGSGFNLIAELKRRQKDAKALMVTAGMPDDVTLQVMESGASGVFLKHSSSDKLVTAINRVASGEVWLDSSALNSLLERKRERATHSERGQPLSTRQSIVLRGILDGLANKEIAWKLNLSESSVKAVIQELFHKTGVRTRSQLVRIAIEEHASDWLKEEGLH